MKRTATIFLQFLRRDFYLYSKQLRRFLVNFGFLRPFFFAFSFAYIQANLVFKTQQTKFVTVFLIGNTMTIVLILTFTMSVKLLFDFKQNRFIDYQISLLHPRLVVLEHILFYSLFSCLVMLPFFPITKLFLQSSFLTTHTSWPQVALILYLGSLCLSAYHFLAVTVMKGPLSITTLWMRINIPMLIMGGFWVPLHIIKQSVPILSSIAYLNPLIYLTEGLRSAILNSPEFLPVWICASALLGFSVFFTLLSFYFFKKKTDHI